MLLVELQPNAHQRIHRAFCPSFSDPSAAGETLQQACHQLAGFTCGCLTHHSRSGIMAWWQEGLNSCGSINSHYVHQLITAHRGAMLTEGPGLHLKHIISQCGSGDTPVEDTIH